MDNKEEKNLLNNLFKEGASHLQNKNHKLAIKKFEEIIKYRPKNSQVLNLTGIAYHQLANLDKALYYVDKAIKYNKNEIGFYINLGNIYKNIKKFSNSLEAYNRALKLNKGSVDALYNIGVLFTIQNDHLKAASYYKKVIKIDQNHKYSLDNLGSAYAELARFEEAIVCYNKAISIDPNFSQAQFNLSLVLLLTNSIKLGWEKYEYRLKNKNYTKNHPFLNYKYWDGSSLENKNLLIYCEQGIGDNIQFARYIKKIKKNNTKIILFCKNTINVFFANFLEINLIINSNKNIPKIDYYVSIMSLPYIFRKSRTPKAFNFFKTNKKLSLFWNLKISMIKKIKVGLVWQGGKVHTSDYKRSIALIKFKPLLETQGIKFISLQQGFGREQIKINKLEKFINDFFYDSDSFQNVFSIIENLDLVISVDTAIAHIAGTMGKETWILLPFVPDFRWGLNKTKTDWYNSVRLFRQKKLNDWDRVILEVKESLIKKIQNI